MIIGSHVDFKKETGLYGSVLKSLSYNSNTFMFYTGAPQNTKRCEVDSVLTKKAHDLMKENGIDINNVIIHAPYIINMANESNYLFNVSFLNDEIKRAKELGIKKIVIHPGSHVGLGIEKGIQNIINVLNNSDDGVDILLETMAGKGTEIGSNFYELKKILDGVSKKIYICLDTCHLNDSGVDINTFDKYLDDFDKIIGINKIKCVHINDSLNSIGSHKDRHANIGYGTIGFDLLNKVVHNDRLKEVPKILETPYIENMPPYKFEIEMFKTNTFNNHLKDDMLKYYKNL